MKTNTIIFLFISTIVLMSCDDDSGHEQKTPTTYQEAKDKDSAAIKKTGPINTHRKETFQLQLSEKEILWMNIIDTLPLLSNVSNANAYLNKNAKSNKNEETISDEIYINGFVTKVQLMYANDKLKSIQYNLSSPNNGKADSLFKAIQQYYIRKTGKLPISIVEEETRYSPTFMIEQKNYKLYLSNNINSNNINWYFESNQE
jgi:hypothetical protein